MSANWLYESNKPDDLLFQIISAEQQWQQVFELESIEQRLDHDVAELATLISTNNTPLNNLYGVIDGIFDGLAYSGPGLQMLPDSSLNCVSYCVMHRTGNQLSLAIVLRHILRRLDFDAFIAELSQDIGLVIKISQSELIVMDMMTGATEYLISSDDVKEILVNEIASFAKEVPQEELVKEILTEQKIAFLEEGLLQQALACVEVLMELLPEDPYERRDRGLVLQQLDCGHWAKDDFDYFIKACPNDPMAVFIKLQLEESTTHRATIH